MTKTTNVFAIDAITLVYTQRIQENGFARMLIVDAGALTNVVTITVEVKDIAGYVVWSKAAVAKNAITRFDGFTSVAPFFNDVPVEMNGSITLTLSGVAGGSGGTITVLTYVDTWRHN
jgi:hypothetical protein